MKTVGNDLVRHQLHENRKWYLGLGILLVLFGFVLLAALPFATLSVVFIFGVLMMIGGVLHFIAAFKIFEGGFRWLWALFGMLYLVAGYYAFTTPVAKSYLSLAPKACKSSCASTTLFCSVCLLDANKFTEPMRPFCKAVECFSSLVSAGS